MAIRRQHAKVGTIAKLAQLAGQNVQARREAERRETMLAQAQEMQFREAMAQQSRNAQMEVRMFDVEADKQEKIAARTWETQKMSLNSQFDLQLEQMKQATLAQRELAKQIRKADEYDLAMNKLNEMRVAENWKDDYYQQAANKTMMKYLGYPGVLPTSQAPSLTRQKGEIEAAMELQGYTPTDLRDFGLNPEDFPAVAEEDISQLSEAELRRIAGDVGL